MERRQFAHFAGQSREQKHDTQEHEQPQSGQQQGDVDPGGHLPHLGIDEQEGVEQQQQRESAHADAGRPANVAEQAPDRPRQDGQHPVAGSQVDNAEDDDVGEDCQPGGGELPTEHNRDEGGAEDEHGEFQPPDSLGPAEQWPNPPQPVDARP